MIKIAVITCYKEPDYIRATTLRLALSKIDNVEIIIIKNRYLNFLKFIEVPLKVLWCRISKRPTKYLITFRGYEILLPVRLITIGKGLYFDEFINLEEWLVFEHKKFKKGSINHKLLHYTYRFMLKLPELIIADTNQHAEYSSKLMNLPPRRFKTIPVGTNEEIFYPSPYKRYETKPLEVFYYGSMLPLHGLEYVFEAAVALKGLPINFTIIGGNDTTESAVKLHIERGAKITYKRRVPFEDLPDYIRKSDVCLGGPFGNTIQSRLVVTGKTYQFLSSNRPTLVGSIDGTSEFIHKENALMVTQGSAVQLQESLVWALENPRQLEDIAKAGNRLYKRRFSLDAISKSLKNII